MCWFESECSNFVYPLTPSDTICDLGGAKELANYGEYSGAPSEQQTYEYAKTVIDLMCRHPHPDGKILIIGGGIANFTNVADTFKGIMRALRAAKTKVSLLVCFSFLSLFSPRTHQST